MSQDHLFSAFKRPRETLGPMNNLYQSGIPQPASAMKRSSSLSHRASTVSNPRMSMAPRGGLPRTSSGGNLADMGMSTGKRPPPSRKSFAPGSSQAPPSARRSSAFGRPSMGHHGGTFFSTLQTSGGARQDPRPLKDAQFKNRMAEEVMEYLLQNGFEMEMKYTLNQNALKSPTQKDFNTIFQWLYRRLDPGYRFASVEKEILPLMRDLRYPYGGNISKSSLSAVGSQTAWPLFLGMLHWLMELAQATDKCINGELDEIVEAEGLDIGSERIMFRYMTQCYNAWLEEDDDHSAFEKEMADAFEARNSTYIDEFSILEAENTRLKAELLELEKSGEPLQQEREMKSILESDVTKFNAWFETTTKKAEKARLMNKTIQEEITKATEQNEKYEKERAALQKQVDAQGLTPTDIDRMNSEREKLNRRLAATHQSLMEAQSKLADAEAEAQSELESLERAVSRYNSLAYKIGITPPSAPHASGKEYELVIAPIAEGAKSGESAKLLTDSMSGFQPADILNRDIKHVVKPMLNKLKQDIAVAVHKLQDDAMRAQDYIERVAEGENELKYEIESKEAKLHALNNEYAEFKDNAQAELNSSNAQLEKQQAALQDIRNTAKNGLLETEQRLQSIKLEYDRYLHSSNAQREKLHSETKRIVEDVIEFKMHVQNNLMEYEKRVEVELQEFFQNAELGSFGQ